MTALQTRLIVGFLLMVGCQGVCSAYEEAIAKTVAEISPKIETAQLKTVAVVDFTDLQGCVSELGRLIAEDMSVALAQTSTVFQVIDRTHLRTILAEHKLNSSGLIDQSTAKELGSLTGVTALVTGSVTPLGQAIKITVKVIDIQSARIIAAASAQVARTASLNDLLSAGIAGGCLTDVPTSNRVGESEGNREPPQSMVVESDGFEVELTDCRLTAGQLVCEVLITNRRSDRWLACGTARFVETQGREYKSKRFRALRNYARDVPMQVTFLFDKVPTLDKLVLLEMECSGNRVKAQWKNVSLATTRGQFRSPTSREIVAAIDSLRAKQ